MPKYTILTPLEVNKRIISKTFKARSNMEWFDHFGKYRNQNVTEYNDKKKEFLALAKIYNKANVETMTCRRIRLQQDYETMMHLDFLKEEPVQNDECDPFCCCLKCEANKAGRLLRKRSLRKMTSITEPKPDVCSIEPWFRRYLTLNKFIWAARTVVIQNRLLSVLNKLKALTAEDIVNIENAVLDRNCEEFHCHPVFLRFL